MYLPIPDWPNRYVADDGTVISMTRKVIKTLVGTINSGGYNLITTKISGGKVTSNKYRHRIVAEAFLPNPEGLPQVNHKDGNKLNNCASNLEWVSAQENVRHAISTGLRNNFGENHGAAVLTELDVKEALLLHHYRFSVKYIANWLGVSEGAIHKIVTNRTWKHIERGG